MGCCHNPYFVFVYTAKELLQQAFFNLRTMGSAYTWPLDALTEHQELLSFWVLLEVALCAVLTPEE